MNQGQGAALPPVTDWFELAAQKPWVPGVYEVLQFGAIRSVWSYWNGKNFLGTTPKPEDAEKFGKSFGQSTLPIARWRGLSANPAHAGLGTMAAIAADALKLLQPVRPGLIRTTSIYYDGPDATFTVEFTYEGKAALQALGHNRGLILQSAIEAALRVGHDPEPRRRDSPGSGGGIAADHGERCGCRGIRHAVCRSSRLASQRFHSQNCRPSPS